MATIAKAEPEHAAAIVDVLGDAFDEDPVMCHAAQGAGFAGVVFGAMYRNIYGPLDFSFCALDDDGVVAGCALWARPGQRHAPSLLGTCRLGFAIRRRGLRVLKRFADLGDFMVASHLKEPHFYLHAIGVRSTHQRQGIGSQLLRHVLEMADSERMPAYLESSNPRNDPLYLRHGFEVTGEANTPNDGPLIRFMRRPPVD